MKCPDIGVLQGYIDGDLDIDLRKNIDNHLINCTKCSAVYKELKDCDDFAFSKINKYKQYADENFIPSRPYKAATIENQITKLDSIDIQSRIKLSKGANGKSSIYKYRKAAAGICAVLAVTVCLSIQPVRAAILSVLTIFRVEDVTGISVSVGDIQKIQEQFINKESEIDLQKLGKIKNTGGQRHQATLSEADKTAGFPVMRPSSLADSKFDVYTIDPEVIEFTLDVNNTNEILKSFGSEKLLPESIDHKTFSIKLSRSISLKYHIQGEDIGITQTTAPEIIVPEGVDADEIYHSLVELPIIPEDLQRQLKSIKDWKNTIYLPITGADTVEVEINGAKGFTGSKTYVTGRTYSVIVWSDNGIIRTIEGNIGRDEIIEIARSMK